MERDDAVSHPLMSFHDDRIVVVEAAAVVAEPDAASVDIGSGR